MLPEHETIVPEEPATTREFDMLDDEPGEAVIRARVLQRRASGIARQVALDPDEEML